MKKHFYHNAILDVTTDCHLTVEEIFDAVQKQFPNAGKSTIYRNVEELAADGRLHKISGVGKKSYFESASHPHAHLIDTNTGSITDVPLPDLNISLPKGFQPAHVDIRIFGTQS